MIAFESRDTSWMGCASFEIQQRSKIAFRCEFKEKHFQIESLEGISLLRRGHKNGILSFLKFKFQPADRSPGLQSPDNQYS